MINHSSSFDTHLRAVLFDFGGVFAEEGFKDGLHSIAIQNRCDPDAFIDEAFDIIYDTGFVLGKVGENVFWRALDERFSMKGSMEEWREEILSRFTIRPWMVEVALSLKKQQIIVGLLTDQCHWLDELNTRNPFFQNFDHIFNSYYTHISKKDPEAFERVIKELQVPPEDILFIDDHEAHILRAQQRGLQTILYLDKTSFIDQLHQVVCEGNDVRRCLQSTTRHHMD
jgi:putative hydrolase of the HAD superfamily